MHGGSVFRACRNCLGCLEVNFGCGNEPLIYLSAILKSGPNQYGECMQCSCIDTHTHTHTHACTHTHTHMHTHTHTLIYVNE